jgi:hypothetical protein
MAQIGPEPQPQVDPATGQPIVGKDGNPLLQVHALGAGKYDLAVKTGPSFTTQREAASTFMTETIRAYPQAAPVIAPELFKSMDFPGADKIAEKLEALGQQQVPEEVQQQLQDMQQMIVKLQEENQKLKLDKSDKIMDVQSDHILGEQKLAQEMELGVMKIEADKQSKFYTAQVNAQAMASRPAPQKSGNSAAR